MSLKDLVKVAEKAENEGFSAVMSNPPYQMSSDKTLFTTAVYHHFMEVGQTISRFVSMIYPSRWTQSGIGEGIKDFKEKELASTNYVKYFDISNSQNVFEGVEIAGGMNYFLWDKCKVEGNIEYYYDGAFGLKRTLSSSDQHIRDIRLVKVVEEKINTSNSLFDIVAPRGYYGTERADQIEELSKEVLKSDETLRMFYISKGLQSVFLKKSYTDKDLSDFKVGISKTANRVSGLAYPRADRIFLMYPGDACTISFMKVGSFDTKEEAVNCLRYLKTDFANFLLAAVTPAQNMYRKSYILLPNVNFATGEILDKPGTFLDFSRPETLDEQLAVIYGLTEEEQELMSKDLKPWKDKVDVDADR